MNGWRGRIGLIIPSANSNMEPEFYKMAPDEVSTHTSRMLLPKLTVENLIEMGKLAVKAALELKTAAVDILVFGCTSGSFVKGLGHDREIVDALEGATSIPAITTSTAVLEAFKLLGVKRVSVASPYTDDINQKLETFLEQNGLDVLALKGLGLGDRRVIFPLSDQETATIGIQEPYIAYKLVKQLASANADAYFVPCTNLRTVEIISRLEDDLQKPVITSNQASLAMALRRLGIRKAVHGFGRLFDL
jgi:maleate isomerase